MPGSASWSDTPALLAGLTFGRLSTGANVAVLFPVDDPQRTPTQMTAIAVGWQLTAALQPVVEASLTGGRNLAERGMKLAGIARRPKVDE